MKQQDSKRQKAWMTGTAAAITVAAMMVGAGATASGPVSAQTTGTPGQANANKFPLTLRDQAGHTVTIPRRPVRIASGTEGTDEILADLVPKADVVLVTTNASDPTQSSVVSWAKGIPAMQQANAEQIIGVRPDIVLLASYTQAGVVNQIEQASIPVYEFANFNSIHDLEQNIQTVGRLVGASGKAAVIVRRMNQHLSAVAHSLKGVHKVTVLNYSSFGYVAGRGTTVNDEIVDAGGINAASQYDGWKAVTPEEVVKLNPDVIIDTTDDVKFANQLLHDPKFQTLNAIKNHRVYIIDPVHLMSVSQYIVRGVDDVARLLYPHRHVQS